MVDSNADNPNPPRKDEPHPFIKPVRYSFNSSPGKPVQPSPDITPQKKDLPLESNQDVVTPSKTHTPKNVFDIVRKPRTDTAKDFSSEMQDPPSGSEQEMLRVAAIQCARMEDTLANIINDTGETSIIDGNRTVLIMKSSEMLMLKTKGGNIGNIGRGEELGDRMITFMRTKEPSNDASRLGVNTNTSLSIPISTHEPTNKAFEEFERQNPNEATSVSTTFFVTLNGEHGKIIRLPRAITPTPDLKLLLPSTNFPTYTAPMTIEDFELLRTALQMSMENVKPQEQPTE